MTQLFFFIPVTGNKFPVTRNIVYFTEKDPSLTDTPFVTGSFSCDMGIFHHVIGNVPSITRRTAFLWSLGCLIRVFRFRDKCAGFTIKISCETLGFPGNLVPWFPGIIPPCFCQQIILSLETFIIPKILFTYIYFPIINMPSSGLAIAIQFEKMVCTKENKWRHKNLFWKIYD